MLIPVDFLLLLVQDLVGASGQVLHGSPRIKCPVGYDYFSHDACAHVSKNYMNQVSAKAYCESRGGNLMEIHSYTEQDLTTLFMMGHSEKYFWLGATDIEIEEQWKWPSGFPMNYKNWLEDHPHPNIDKNCAGIYSKNDYKWKDYTCTAKEHKAFCKHCPITGLKCPGNQKRQYDGCCYCNKTGFIPLLDHDICVGQSSYSTFGEPEFAYDGNSHTFMHTDIEETPWIEFHFPNPIKLEAVVIQLRESSDGVGYCSREHHLEAVLTDEDGQEVTCGRYEGFKGQGNCDGKLHIIKCASVTVTSSVKLIISDSDVKMCSQVSAGEVCVQDDAYLGVKRNVIQLSEVSYQTPQ